ncbi:acyloxyacyl hydrolase [Alteromonas sp. AMM-1]|uniref:acyloxyacyl hydrolase n=1 Tax=Alteromonas sp. AMM-1 TaxID=3394233 RepID=UPI0039A4D654
MKVSKIKQWLGAVFTAGMIVLSVPSAGMADEISVDYIRGEGDVQGVKLAFRRNSDYLHAYFPSLDLSFEASINLWEYGDPSRYDSNFVLAFSPVFRHTFYENYNGAVYGEFGIGVSLLDDTQFAGKDISTHFQFEDRLGIGYRFGSEREHAVTLRYFHYSNGGLKSPNPGYDFISLSFSTRL